jgi:hypothetical protein
MDRVRELLLQSGSSFTLNPALPGRLRRNRSSRCPHPPWFSADSVSPWLIFSQPLTLKTRSNLSRAPGVPASHRTRSCINQELWHSSAKRRSSALRQNQVCSRCWRWRARDPFEEGRTALHGGSGIAGDVRGTQGPDMRIPVRLLGFMDDLPPRPFVVGTTPRILIAGTPVLFGLLGAKRRKR